MASISWTRPSDLLGDLLAMYVLWHLHRSISPMPPRAVFSGHGMVLFVILSAASQARLDTRTRPGGAIQDET